jgi:hypothetical protein
VVVDDPVHELEAAEGDGEEDAAVLVDVRGGDAEHGVDVAWREEGDGRRWRRRHVGHRHFITTLAQMRSEKRYIYCGTRTLKNPTDLPDPAPALTLSIHRLNHIVKYCFCPCKKMYSLSSMR